MSMSKQLLSANYVKISIEKSTDSPLYRLCRQKSENVTQVSWHRESASEDEMNLH